MILKLIVLNIDLYYLVKNYALQDKLEYLCFISIIIECYYYCKYFIITYDIALVDNILNLYVDSFSLRYLQYVNTIGKMQTAVLKLVLNKIGKYTLYNRLSLTLL
jgi:hypothetical protein